MKRILLYTGLSVLTLVLILSCSTSRFFYVPSSTFREIPDTSKYTYEDLSFEGGNHKLLNGWFFHPRGKVRGTVLHLHGNGGNISYQYQFAMPLVDSGYQVFVFDYEGYGKSQGSPSQENVLDDAMAALQFVRARKDVQDKPLILFGQSLGGHLSCVAAAKAGNQIDALVIEGAFSGHDLMAAHVGHNYHIPGWFARMIVRTEYEGIDYISQVKVPKLIIHSTEDAVCPFYMGKDLFEKAVGQKEFWEIRGGHIQASVLYPVEFVQRFNKLIE